MTYRTVAPCACKRLAAISVCTPGFVVFQLFPDEGLNVLPSNSIGKMHVAVYPLETRFSVVYTREFFGISVTSETDLRLPSGSSTNWYPALSLSTKSGRIFVFETSRPYHTRMS